jgi:hypothetical protein
MAARWSIPPWLFRSTQRQGASLTSPIELDGARDVA